MIYKFLIDESLMTVFIYGKTTILLESLPLIRVLFKNPRLYVCFFDFFL